LEQFGNTEFINNSKTVDEAYAARSVLFDEKK
jgi:hypothetical protein